MRRRGGIVIRGLRPIQFPLHAVGGVGASAGGLSLEGAQHARHRRVSRWARKAFGTGVHRRAENTSWWDWPRALARRPWVAGSRKRGKSSSTGVLATTGIKGHRPTALYRIEIEWRVRVSTSALFGVRWRRAPPRRAGGSSSNAGARPRGRQEKPAPASIGAAWALLDPVFKPGACGPALSVVQKTAGTTGFQLGGGVYSANGLPTGARAIHGSTPPI